MNKTTLLIAALIVAAAIYLTACTDTSATPTPAPALASITTSTADTTAPTTTTATAATTPAPVAKVCPDSYTPKRGAQAGQPQTVHTGSRGGCYYLNASGTKTYLKK